MHFRYLEFALNPGLPGSLEEGSPRRPQPSRSDSRKGAKGGKAGDGIKMDFFTGGNGDNRDKLKNFVFSVLSC